uniref:Putative 28 kDa metastriate family member n=1 Tax=Rhipicephalus pulchellus TaxID=72859 RepID=L7MBG4_RHIPC
MKSLRLILLFVCCFYDAEATISKKLHSPQRNGVWNDWREALRSVPKYIPYMPNETIGNGVVLNAVALYDSNFYDSTKQNKVVKERTSGSDTDVPKNPVEDYFHKFFQKVEDYFKSRSIEITIHVKSVTQIDNLIVYFEGTGHGIDSHNSLENIKRYGAGRPKTTDTIFYLFTWPQPYENRIRLFDEINPVPPHRSGVSESATNGTFCSNLTSAAFIRHKYGDYNIWSTVKATFSTFGTPQFMILYEKDYREMNETFMRCPKGSSQNGVTSSSEPPQPLAC